MWIIVISMYRGFYQQRWKFGCDMTMLVISANMCFCVQYRKCALFGNASQPLRGETISAPFIQHSFNCQQKSHLESQREALKSHHWKIFCCIRTETFLITPVYYRAIYLYHLTLCLVLVLLLVSKDSLLWNLWFSDGQNDFLSVKILRRVQMMMKMVMVIMEMVMFMVMAVDMVMVGKSLPYR